MNNAKIIGIIDEDPYNYRTWSGISKFFFNALKNNGALEAAISAKASSLDEKIAKCISFHPDFAIWKNKYHLSNFLFKKMSDSAAKKLFTYKGEWNSLLQIGAWYNFSDYPQLKGKLFCSYHDGNLWAQIKRYNSRYDLNSTYIKKALTYEQKLYDKLDLIFPMSEWLRQIFISDFKCDPSKVIVAGAGINFHNIPEITNKDYSRPKILFVGVNFTRKGGDILLKSFKKVKDKIPTAELTIIGPLLKDVPSGVKCLGRINKDTIEGERLLQQAYLEASLFVMPSLYEPFGIVFGEAMAHKLPCIGTNVCAMPEIIDDGKTGFLVPVGDSNLLAERIIELLKNPDMLKMFGEAGYQKYLHHFTWSKVAEKIINSMSMKLC